MLVRCYLKFCSVSHNIELDLWFLQQVDLVALQANTLMVCLVASDSLPDPHCRRAVPPSGYFFAQRSAAMGRLSLRQAPSREPDRRTSGLG
jgi:hypothetical protein